MTQRRNNNNSEAKTLRVKVGDIQQMSSNFMCIEYNSNNNKQSLWGVGKQRMVEINKAGNEIVIEETKQQRQPISTSGES